MGDRHPQSKETTLDDDPHSDSNASTMPSTSAEAPSTSLLSRIKRHLSLRTMREKWASSSWAPLMAAKSNLDSDYNFPRSRYAGQGYNFPPSRYAGEGTPYQRQ